MRFVRVSLGYRRVGENGHPVKAQFGKIVANGGRTFIICYIHFILVHHSDMFISHEIQNLGGRGHSANFLQRKFWRCPTFIMKMFLYYVAFRAYDMLSEKTFRLHILLCLLI